MYSKITRRPTIVHCWKRYRKQTIRRRRHGSFLFFERKTESIIREYCRRQKKKKKKFTINCIKGVCVLTSKETTQGIGYNHYINIKASYLQAGSFSRCGVWGVFTPSCPFFFFFFLIWYVQSSFPRCSDSHLHKLLRLVIHFFHLFVLP